MRAWQSTGRRGTRAHRAHGAVAAGAVAGRAPRLQRGGRLGCSGCIEGLAMPHRGLRQMFGELGTIHRGRPLLRSPRWLIGASVRPKIVSAALRRNAFAIGGVSKKRSMLYV